MPEEAAVGGEDAEGVAAVEDGGGFVVETVGGEEYVHAVTGGDAMVLRAEVDDLVGYEGVAQDSEAEF